MNEIAVRVAPANGDRVLWIHGYTLDSSVWRELWSLMPHWYHIGVDLPGHGVSGPMISGEDLAGLARRIGQLAFAHQVDHLVGLSFGGTVALQVALLWPGLFRSLVLGAPGLGGGPQDPAAQVRNLELIRLYRMRGAGSWMTELWMQSPPDIFTGAARHPRLWEQLQEVLDRHSWLELRDPTIMNKLSNYRQREEDLRHIQVPTLLLIGEHDMPAFKRSAELIRRSIPMCERIYVPEVGHLCLLEAPAHISSLLDTHFRKARSN